MGPVAQVQVLPVAPDVKTNGGAPHDGLYVNLKRFIMKNESIQSLHPGEWFDCAGLEWVVLDPDKEGGDLK